MAAKVGRLGTNAKFSGYKRIAGSQIGAKSSRVWACKSCGQWATKKPAQCGCGRMDFQHFHSKAEATRYYELILLQNRGLIKDLELQPSFTLRAYPDGEVVSKYIADSRYFDVEKEKWVVEDVKGRAIDPLAMHKIKHYELQYKTEVKLIKR